MNTSDGFLRTKSGGYQLVFYVGLWLAVYSILYVISPAVPSFDSGSVFFRGRYILPLISGLILLFTTLFVIQASVQVNVRHWVLFVALFSCVVIDNYSHRLGLAPFYAFILSDLSIICGAVCIGKLVVHYIEERSWIVPIALVAMVADVWSVTWGPTAVLMEASTDKMRHFLIYYPLLGASELFEDAFHELGPYIGMGDVIFLSIFLELVRKFDLHAQLSRLAFVVALLVPITLASFAEKGIPALPFMSAMFLAVNFRRLEFKKSDLLKTCIFVAVLMVIVYVAYHNHQVQELFLGQGKGKS
jgi:hypothetical protein